MQTSTERNATIQSLRAVAALMVAVMHLCGWASRGGNESAIWLRMATHNVGLAGVDIFFVISGLMIVIMMQAKPTAWSFALRRAARIYPLYWITLGSLVLNAYIFNFWPGILQLLQNPGAILLLTPASVHPVSWTLVFEIQFYIVATVCLLFGRHATSALVMWCILQTGLVFASELSILPKYFFLSPLTLEFVFGIVIGLVAPRVSLPFPSLFAIVGFALPIAFNLIFGVDFLGQNQYLRILCWGFPSAFVVWAALSWKGKPMPKLVYLGDISYSIYMWHWLIAALLIRVWGSWLATPAGVGSYLAVSLFCVIAVSWISFEYCEKPINKWASNFSKSIDKRSKVLT